MQEWTRVGEGGKALWAQKLNVVGRHWFTRYDVSLLLRLFSSSFYDMLLLISSHINNIILSWVIFYGLIYILEYQTNWIRLPFPFLQPFGPFMLNPVYEVWCGGSSDWDIFAALQFGEAGYWPGGLVNSHYHYSKLGLTECWTKFTQATWIPAKWA